LHDERDYSAEIVDEASDMGKDDLKIGDDGWTEIVGASSPPSSQNKNAYNILGELMTQSSAFAEYAKKRAAAGRPIVHKIGAGISVEKDEQAAEAPSYREDWLAVYCSTKSVDRDAAEKRIRGVYVNAKKKTPKSILWCRSPMETAAEATRCAITEKMNNPWWRDKLDAISFSLPTTLDLSRAAVPVVGCEISNRVGSHYNADAEKIVQNVLAQAHFGSHHASQFVQVDFAHRVLQDKNCKKLLSLVEVARVCGWTWFFDDVAITTERPTKMLVDEKGELHCVDGQAIEYSDGFGACAWHGVRVPHAAILSPGDYEWDAVLSTANVALKSALTEIKAYHWSAGRDDYYDAALAAKRIGGEESVKKLTES
jgi:uncharacterized protein DUF6745